MTIHPSLRVLSSVLLAGWTAVVLSPKVVGADSRSSGSAAAPAPMSAREKALHALNRLAFGPRPGDAERVASIGVSKWIERQLEPDGIPDPEIASRLRDLPTLSMSSSEIFATYEKPLRDARRQRREAANASASSMKPGDPAADASAASEQEELRNQIPPGKRPRRVIEELSAARLLRAAYSERQTNEVLVDFWMNHFNVYAAKGIDRAFITSFERDVVRPRIWGKFEDLLLATAKSPAMLFYLDNAQSVAAPENRALPERAMGARRWAMGGRNRPEAPAAGTLDPAKARRGGLNENYARELMELHTLGVDGGYTQRDVTELARVLTGWSIDREEGQFVFRPRAHDAGTKTVLGTTFAGGGLLAGAGIEEGERAIRMLARHPSTARHIAFQLCQRLVADAPPPALVDRIAKRFLATDGDLRQTVRAIVQSPEFFAPDSYRAKVKSPFEYVVSAIRAAGAETDGRPPVLRELAKMGEPLYLCQPPTGYSDVSSAWVSSGSLVARLNFAIALAGNRIPGTRVDLGVLLGRGVDAPEPEKSVESLSRIFLGGDLSPETRRTIESRLESRAAETTDPSADPLFPSQYGPSKDGELPLVAGLILGSPEFQRQ